MLKHVAFSFESILQMTKAIIYVLNQNFKTLITGDDFLGEERTKCMQNVNILYGISIRNEEKKPIF